jgi:hypothetical protein
MFLRVFVTLHIAIAFSTHAQLEGGVRTLPAKEKRWALLIGVDRYQNPEMGLGGAANDARTLRDALVSTAGFPAEQVIVLASGEPPDRLPTRSNILRRLSNLLTTSVPLDGLFLLAFSGHGIERDGEVYLYPSDMQSTQDVSLLKETAISLALIHDRIQSSRIPQVLLLLDSCRNNPGGRADDPNRLSEGYLKPLSFDIRNKAVRAYATFFATALNHRAYEYAEKRQGYFTWAIVEGLRGAAANERGEVTLSRLCSYIQEVVPKRVAADLGEVQQPFVKIDGFLANDLILATVPSQPAANEPSELPLSRPRIAVIAGGDDASFAALVEEEMERRLRGAYDVADEHGDTDVDELLNRQGTRLDPKTLGAALLKSGFHILVLLRVEQANHRMLNSGEISVFLKSARVRMNAQLLTANRTIGSGWSELTEYTDDSAPQIARQAFIGPTADLRKAINDEWAQQRTAR